MNRLIVATLSLTVVGLLPVMLRADWDLDSANPDWKMHYPQLPDLTHNGMDVYSTPARPDQQITLPDGTVQTLPALPGKYLADDWRCTETGYIRDIHIWGSWLNDIAAPQLAFDLVIYTDLPGGIPGGPDYSQPAQEIWRTHFDPGQYVARLYDQVPEEQFYDPNRGELIGTDHAVWQYNFFMDAADACWQDRDTIYWLSVQPIYPTWTVVDPDPTTAGDEFVQEFLWGWKTTNPLETPHFNDDAVYWDVDLTGLVGPYLELRYPAMPPIDTPLWDESVDLSFVITPEPATMGLLGIGLVGLVARRRRR